MKYDFNFLEDYFKDYNVTINIDGDTSFKITLDQEVTIYFQNAENEDDLLIAFVNGEWHCHGDIIFSGKNGYYISLNYIDFISEIIEGNVLICLLYSAGKLKDIFPIHKNYFDELDYMEFGEELRIKKLKIEKKFGKLNYEQENRNIKFFL